MQYIRNNLVFIVEFSALISSITRDRFWICISRWPVAEVQVVVGFISLSGLVGAVFGVVFDRLRNFSTLFGMYSSQK